MIEDALYEAKRTVSKSWQILNVGTAQTCRVCRLSMQGWHRRAESIDSMQGQCRRAESVDSLCRDSTDAQSLSTQCRDSADAQSL